MAGDKDRDVENYCRPRLSHNELWILYRLVDSRYWSLRKYPEAFCDTREVGRLRLKLMRNLNRKRSPERQLSVRRRIY